MSYSRGQVVLVMFPDSNLRTAKRRPALVIQADNLQTNLSQLVLAMISSQARRAGHPSRVLITQGTEVATKAGLRLDSVIMTDVIITVREAEIHRALGSLPDMTAVEAALRHTLAL